MTASPVLECKALEKRFGGLIATNNVSLRLEEGARHALIGPNGAGKTTLINLLTGVLPPTSGAIYFAGEDITTVSREKRVKRGLVRTFQINQLFGSLSVLESLALALAESAPRAISLWRPLASDRALIAQSEALSEQFGLKDALTARVSDLPYGKQRLVEIALAFAAKPRVLLLDEPAAGVSAQERRELLSTIAALPRSVAVLLIEHDMDVVFSFAEHISVLVNGAIFADGMPDAIAKDARVRAVYLGEQHNG